MLLALMKSKFIVWDKLATNDDKIMILTNKNHYFIIYIVIYLRYWNKSMANSLNYQSFSILFSDFFPYVLQTTILSSTRISAILNNFLNLIILFNFDLSPLSYRFEQKFDEWNWLHMPPILWYHMNVMWLTRT